MKKLLTLLVLVFSTLHLSSAWAAYADNGDGTVTDSATGLTWMRCAMGQTWSGSTCSGTAGNYTWDQATALRSNFSGQSDWRLPNIRELQTIVDRSVFSPAIDKGAFPNTPSSSFWSGSPYADDSDFAWFVGFSVGYVSYFYRDSGYGVRLVRGGHSLGLLDSARPSNDYVDQGDGTVIHTPTGLMWQRCAVGQTWTGSTCSGSESSLTWDAAMQLTSNLSGKTGWRLPTEEELLSLVDYSRSSPAINTDLFPGTSSSHFWSGSPDAYNSTSAWFVRFFYGYAYSGYRGVSLSVRLVRGGKYSASLQAQGWNLLGNSGNQPLSVSAVFGDPARVTTVWKWDVTTPGWQFYTPAMDAAALQTYAASKGYGVLSVINPGEGYWVNAKAAASLASQSGSAFSLGAGNLVKGWNLVATGNNVTPSAFNQSLSDTPPAQGTVPLNLTTLWAWDSASSQWYFYAPSLEASDGLANYIATKGYRDFTAAGKTLGNGTGFWVNKP